ncbi:iron-containing alcohol dehydrogenase family protein [Paraburkholderia domus]|uniref:Lactaldehyde reductase n=1 Tax=Paraburkholderia domus TaxID=2793075 RepID=A0A9N8N800_9BURK|nr:iron-containing alcohol dehydrogenase family protein [Paraburkholderia domus]MBK5054515.1 iron-containing alcohol dehydrogenase [Burkholderia sp. R-70006]MBK5066102.1 iron-containing alcohol dehydrogenase [Burkholderia sp. R-70199]MBK5122210.1 iron-containing alcohol dehydrogenase [Burkholderia sp. R-69980]MBK5169722.1 iron-containing alcohol dehydrogenase [Burkholderia sp. R-70211]MBK5185423.1 iron-containing alcohol dehydrogenase [Burkholderia sp. R-69749]
MSMQNFQHITPPLRLFHGPDSLSHLGRELDRIKSQRAVVICGDWLTKGPLFERIRAALGERCAGVYGEVLGHSPVASVEDAAALLRRVEADAVIAVGGGSSIVTARAASILAAEGKPVSELCTVTEADGSLRSPKLSMPKLPQFIVPTTPTTATVKAGSAVFDPASGQRLAMFDPKTRVQSVFIDPEMILSAPRGLVATASINTLSMAIEGLTSRSQDTLAQGTLMHALRLIDQYLPQAAREDDAAVRGQLVLAAILCGQGTDHTAAGITTVLGHAIGACHEIENGTVNAIVLPHVLRFNAEAAVAGMADVAAALDLQRSSAQESLQQVIEKVTTFFDDLGVPRRLRDVKVPREGLADIAAHAMGDWFLRGNPRPVRSAAELQQILEEAW